jgi:hypothetical protein
MWTRTVALIAYMSIAVSAIAIDPVGGMAQQTLLASSISGQVEDSIGAAVVGATVTVTKRDTGGEIKVTTNSSGNYIFPSLAPAHYDLMVTALGFKTFVEANVLLTANQSLSVDAKLKIGAATETVRVEANTPDSFAALDSASATRASASRRSIVRLAKVEKTSLLRGLSVLSPDGIQEAVPYRASTPTVVRVCALPQGV